MAYPVTVGVEPQMEHRNRLTVALRLILAIPHAILVGPIFAGVHDEQVELQDVRTAEWITAAVDQVKPTRGHVPSSGV